MLQRQQGLPHAAVTFQLGLLPSTLSGCQVAIGMYSGEGEYVPFATDCACDGPVEVWLQRVVDAMRAALSAEFRAAIPAYDERPRTKWIFDHSAQNTVVVSRLFFTQEVGWAAARLGRAGHERASRGWLKFCLQQEPGASLAPPARPLLPGLRSMRPLRSWRMAMRTRSRQCLRSRRHS